MIEKDYTEGYRDGFKDGFDVASKMENVVLIKDNNQNPQEEKTNVDYGAEDMEELKRLNDEIDKKVTKEIDNVVLKDYAKSVKEVSK